MKRILCSLLVVILPFGSVLADAPKSKNANVTLVYQHELPNVPGKSIKGVLVEYGPGGYSPGCLLYTSPSPRDRQKSRMPSSA